MIDGSRYQHVTFEMADNGVLVARLNRPERLNAINERMFHELAQLPLDADMDVDVRVLVITGEGRAFCSGGDLYDPISTGPTTVVFKLSRQIVENLLACEKPIIAAVNGPARGLGATIALLCDVVFADRTTTFADTHVHIGAGAGDGGQLIFPLLMGVNRAKYYLMTGDVIDAEEAVGSGLVNFLVDGSALDAALTLAQRLALGPQHAIRASKVAVNSQMRALAANIIPLGLAAERFTGTTLDHHEAGQARTEKRQPNYTGQ